MKGRSDVRSTRPAARTSSAPMHHEDQPRQGSLTFDDFVRERYWPTVSAPLSPASLDREPAVLDRVLALWGTRPLDSITVEDIDRWHFQLRAETSPATVNKHRYRVRHLFATAHRWGLIHRNPAYDIRRLPEPKGRVRWLSDDERDLLISKADPVLRLYILFGRFTGLRRRNLHELRWRDVDLANGVIRIPVIKNGDSHVVQMIPALRELLEKLGADGRPDDGYVLPRVYPCSISRSFRKLCESLRIKNCRFHDLRHDVASRLAMTGASQKLIMEVLGHRDPKMSTRYTHISPEAIREALQRAL